MAAPRATAWHACPRPGAQGPGIRERLDVANSPGALLDLAIEPQVVVVDASTAHPDAIPGLRARWPGAGLVAWIPDSIPLDDAVVWIRESDDVIVPSERTDPTEVAEIIAGARGRSLSAMVVEAMEPIVPHRMAAFLGELVRRARGPISVEEAASVYCASAGTLRRHLRAAGLPPIRGAIT